MNYSDSSHSLSVATIGTKGQIVIPAEVRERLRVKPGDKVVLLIKDQQAAVLLPMECVRSWMDKMTADIDKLSTLVSDESNKQGEA